MPDEQRADCAGYMGNSVIQTPILDRFAAEHSAFSNFFVNHTVCSPSRVSMFTGWYPHVRGHRTLWHLLQPDEPNVFRYLREAGYHVEMWGKNDLLSPESLEYSISNRGEVDFETYRQNFTGIPWSKDDHRYRTFYFGERPAELSSEEPDRLWMDGALNFLNSNPPEPFCLYIPLIFPHCPYWVEEPYFSLHDRDEVPQPMPANHERKPKYFPEIHQSYDINEMSDGDLRELVATYYGMCTRIDDQFGEILNALKQNHFWDNTAVFYYSDHGDYAGDYGLVEKWPSGFEDCLIRSPLAIRLPGVEAQPMNHAMCETVDLTPTILDIAGIELEHDQYGESLVPLLRGEQQELKDAVFCEGGHNRDETQAIEMKEDAPHKDYIYYQKARIQTDDPDTVCKSAMIRTPKWKYIHRLRDTDELYDLEADPGEQHNVVDVQGNEQVQQALLERLLNWFLETGDVVPYHKDPR